MIGETSTSTSAECRWEQGVRRSSRTQRPGSRRRRSREKSALPLTRHLHAEPVSRLEVVGEPAQRLIERGAIESGASRSWIPRAALSWASREASVASPRPAARMARRVACVRIRHGRDRVMLWPARTWPMPSAGRPPFFDGPFPLRRSARAYSRSAKCSCASSASNARVAFSVIRFTSNAPPQPITRNTSMEMTTSRQLSILASCR